MSEHELKECTEDCEGCMFCDGDLALCTVCGGAEIDLPMECPGRKMTDEERSLVGSGKLDYYNDAWQVTAKRGGYADE